MNAIEFGLKAVAMLAFIFCGCVALSLVLAWLDEWMHKP